MPGIRRAPKRLKAAALVWNRIEASGERLWRLEDFSDLSGSAVAQALSRLARAGFIQRLSKGVYYRGRRTALGRSRASPAAIAKLASSRRAIFPSGIAAANLLGFTTQNAARPELAISGASVPRKLVGEEAVVHTRRPEAWSTLTETEAALLDFLRRGGEGSELSEKETLRRTLHLLREERRFERLVAVAASEPPRVRALLGALGELLEKPERTTERLRALLNPLSKFDFGVYSTMPNARAWQAKGRGE